MVKIRPNFDHFAVLNITFSNSLYLLLPNSRVYLRYLLFNCKQISFKFSQINFLRNLFCAIVYAMPTVSKKRKACSKNVSARYTHQTGDILQQPSTSTAVSQNLNFDNSMLEPEAILPQPMVDRPKLIDDRPKQRDEDITTSTGGQDFNNFICNIQSFSAMMAQFPCSQCLENKLSVTFKPNLLSSIAIVTCCECDHVSEYSLGSSSLADAVVMAGSQIGIGQKQINVFSSIVGLPLIGQRLYDATFKNILLHNFESFQKMLSDARDHVYQNYLVLGSEPDKNGNIKIDVSYDGSWMSRGFSSQYGVGAVIDCVTGLILDISVLSKYCHQCHFPPKNKSSAFLEAWKEKHSLECQKNYDGSSPSMEVANAKCLWQRSIEKGKFIYKTMLSDGDAKTIACLNSEKVYGTDCEIEKRECLNHVSKRLGTALRKARQEKKLGGRGIGTLTDTKINKLTNYYGKAIRSHSESIDEMKKAIYATLSHCSSTDSKPDHGKCTKGKGSWCFFQRALANDTIPDSHTKKLTTYISQSVVTQIMPIYMRLASNDLLKRCQNAGTQNDNESFHNVLWTKCPKNKFCGLKKVQLAAYQAVSSYNHGISKSFTAQMKALNLPVTSKAIKFFLTTDRKRLQNNAKRSIDKSKRILLRRRKILAEELKQMAEGPTYGAGQF